MHRITVQYAVPGDPDVFDRRYRDEHAPLVRAIPGLAAFTWATVQPMNPTDGPLDIYQVAEMDFPDADTLRAALGSAEMTAAARHAADLGVPMTMFSGELLG